MRESSANLRRDFFPDVGWTKAAVLKHRLLALILGGAVAALALAGLVLTTIAVIRDETPLTAGIAQSVALGVPYTVGVALAAYAYKRGDVKAAAKLTLIIVLLTAAAIAVAILIGVPIGGGGADGGSSDDNDDSPSGDASSSDSGSKFGRIRLDWPDFGASGDSTPTHSGGEAPYARQDYRLRACPGCGRPTSGGLCLACSAVPRIV